MPDLFEIIAAYEARRAMQTCRRTGCVEQRWSAAVYCSRQCYALDKRTERIARVCQCGQSFETTAALVSFGRGVYCSVPCRQTYRPKLKAVS